MKRRGMIWDFGGLLHAVWVGSSFEGTRKKERGFGRAGEKKKNGPDHYFFKYKRVRLGNDPADALLIHNGGCV